MILIKNGIPYGYGELKWQYSSWWIVSVMASRCSPKGTGKEILNVLIAEAIKKGIPNLRLGTHYNNTAMANCAKACGFTVERQNKNGFIMYKNLEVIK